MLGDLYVRRNTTDDDYMNAISIPIDAQGKPAVYQVEHYYFARARR